MRRLPLFPCIAYGFGQRSLSWRGLLGRSEEKSVPSAPPLDDMPEVFRDPGVSVPDYIRPERSSFEKLEDFWESFLLFMEPIELQVSAVRYLHSTTIAGAALGWGSAFFVYGAMIRFLSIPLALYGQRNSLRLAHIGTPLTDLNNNLKRVKNDRSLSGEERRILKEGYTRFRKALMKKHGCAQWKSFAQGITGPIMVTALMAVRRLAEYETELENSSFFWVRDLTMPDPTGALPVICGFLFLLNFELNQRLQRGGRSAMALYIRWAVRLGVVATVYFVQSQPSALFAYWIGMSIVGMMQPMILRSTKFRDAFGFPPPPHAAREMMGGAMKRPSWVQRWFYSKERLAQLEAERAEAMKQSSSKKVQTIDDDAGEFEDIGLQSQRR